VDFQLKIQKPLRPQQAHGAEQICSPFASTNCPKKPKRLRRFLAISALAGGRASALVTWAIFSGGIPQSANSPIMKRLGTVKASTTCKCRFIHMSRRKKYSGGAPAGIGGNAPAKLCDT